MPDPEKGLYKKFVVYEVGSDGRAEKEVEDFTFTLIPEKDPVAYKALVTYALNADEPLRSELFAKLDEIEGDLDVPADDEFTDEDDAYCQGLLDKGEYEAYGAECDEVDG